MSCRFHRFVQRDVNGIRDYYLKEAGFGVSDEFFEELMDVVHQSAAQPTRFHPYAPGLRRANLDRFPFHFLYRIRSDFIFVLVVRHNRRHPAFGLSRR